MKRKAMTTSVLGWILLILIGAMIAIGLAMSFMSGAESATNPLLNLFRR